MGILIKNCNYVDVKEEEIKTGDILIEAEIIKRIDKDIKTDDNQVINCKGKYLLPGLVDIHAHFREPGFEYKETIRTGSMAAAKGGYTTVFVMPNTNPVIDNVKTLEELKKIIEMDSIINTLPIGAVSMGQKGKILTDIEEMHKDGIYAVSDDGQPIMNYTLMEKALVEANRVGIPLLTHSEDKRLIIKGCINKGNISKELGVEGIPREAENNMIKRDLEIAKKLGLKLHICHVSTKEAVNMIRKAKKEGVKVTCEVTPHHFSITDEIVKEKMSIGKVNPPLRTQEDVEEIIKGIQDGTIDAIATDHAPHSNEEKKLNLYDAPFGISGIELALPITITYLLERNYIDIIKLVKLMSFNPSRIMGIDKGRLYEGCVADLTLVDLNEEFEVKEEDIVSKGTNTPFIGERLHGKVKYTIVAGKIVYRG